MGRGLNATVLRAATLLAGQALLLSASLTFAANPPQVLIETRIVAVSTRDGPAQIWRFNLDGSGGRALTRGSAAHYSPKVSPDGTRIVFTGEDGGAYSIYAMNIDGSGVVRLTRPPMSAGLPAWSPDGTLIAFMGSASAALDYQIWTMKPDGTGQKQLTHLSGSRNASPAFSPDGARIAFASSRTAANGQLTSRIWTMNVDGSNAAAVTVGPGDGYASWINLTSFLFARTTPDDTKSQIFLKTLGGGETPESPANGFYTEPQASADSTRYIATEMSSGGGLFLAWRPLNGDTTQAAAKPVPITVGGDLYNPALIFEAAPPAPTPSGGGAAPSVPASPVAAAPSGVVSIAVPPSSNGGPSLNIWEILIGVGIFVVVIGGITYFVKLRPEKDGCDQQRAAVLAAEAEFAAAQAALDAAEAVHDKAVAARHNADAQVNWVSDQPAGPRVEQAKASQAAAVAAEAEAYQVLVKAGTRQGAARINLDVARKRLADCEGLNDFIEEAWESLPPAPEPDAPEVDIDLLKRAVEPPPFVPTDPKTGRPYPPAPPPDRAGERPPDKKPTADESEPHDPDHIPIFEGPGFDPPAPGESGSADEEDSGPRVEIG